MTTKTPSQIDKSEYFDYFETYIGLVNETDIIAALEDQVGTFTDFMSQIKEEDACVLHDPYTWTIKQVIGHCIDCERVFAYRGLRFVSQDGIVLPGFDQDIYVAANDYENITLAALCDEFVLTRKSNLAMYRRLHGPAWDLTGSADDKQMSVRATAFILVGHLRYHARIIEKRLGMSGQV